MTGWLHGSAQGKTKMKMEIGNKAGGGVLEMTEPLPVRGTSPAIGSRGNFPDLDFTGRDGNN